MQELAPKKAIVYSYFKYSKVDKNNNEIGLICINTIEEPTQERDNQFGWETHSYWVEFSDDLFKYLKGTLIKQNDIVICVYPDYKDSNKYNAKLYKINDFVIKQ